MFLENKLFQFWRKWKGFLTKVILLFTYWNTKIIFRKICFIFDIENWLWKLNFCNFWKVKRSWKKFLSQNHLLNYHSSMKKNQKISINFWHRKLTLKFSFWQFLTWYLLRLFDCLAHPNLSAAFATDEKWPICHLHILCQSLAGSLRSLKKSEILKLITYFILPLFLVPKSRSVAKNEWKKHPYIFLILLVQK